MYTKTRVYSLEKDEKFATFSGILFALEKIRELSWSFTGTRDIVLNFLFNNFNFL